MMSPSPHLDLDALADALAGEGSAADADHLAGCGACAARLAELRAADSSVRSRLAGLGSPALPPDVAARLDAALAGEQPLAPPRSASVTALPPRRDRRTPGWLPAAAAAVLVLGGAGVAVTQLGTGLDASSDTASSAAGGAEAAAGPSVADLRLTASGADWADADAVAGSLEQVLAEDSGTYRLEPPSRARQDSDDQPVSEEAESAEEPMAAAQAPVGTLPDGDEELARLRTQEGLQACLSALLPPEDPGVQPLAVDYATYAGAPALAVVLPDSDPAQASVYVVGSDCGAADPDVLLFRRAPLPQP